MSIFLRAQAVIAKSHFSASNRLGSFDSQLHFPRVSKAGSTTRPCKEPSQFIQGRLGVHL
jgi:hypothetical protein